MSRTTVDGYGQSTVRQDGIRVRKSIIADDADLLVKFSVESDRKNPVALRISDTSAAPERTVVGTGVPGDGECRWTTGEHEVTFSRSVVPGDSFVTGYRVSNTDRTDVSRTLPVIEAIQLIDQEDVRAGIAPRWRSGGTDDGDRGTSAVQLVNRAGSTTETTGVSETRERSRTTADETSESVHTLVAIPAYNEARSITDVVSRTQPYADEVLVIDDGSTDDTAARAQEAGAVVVQHERNRGYGAAIKRTFREADERDAEMLVVVDGDGQHDPSDIPRLLDRQANDHPQIVIGSRFVGDRRSEIPAYRRVGLWLVNAMTNLSMRTIRSEDRVTDTQSGFRAYNAAAIRSLANDGSIGAGMGASTDVLHHARKHSFDIDEVGTEITYDVEHASSHNPISHGIALVSNLLRTIERDHPIALLGLPGFVSSLVGFGFGYWMVANFVASGTFPLGLAISATFFLLIGVFACFTAIILHSLNRYSDAGGPVNS